MDVVKRHISIIYMIFKHVYHEIPRQHYNELISNRLVGHTCKCNLSQNSVVFLADSGFNISQHDLTF